MNKRLRTVPTKFEGLNARLRPRGRSRSLQGLLESIKKNWDSHAFFQDNQPWISTKMPTSAFFWKKEGKDFLSRISIDFAFKCRRANMFIKILKLHGKWKHKKKLLACVLQQNLCNSGFSVRLCQPTSGSAKIQTKQLLLTTRNYWCDE